MLFSIDFESNTVGLRSPHSVTLVQNDTSNLEHLQHSESIQLVEARMSQIEVASDIAK